MAACLITRSSSGHIDYTRGTEGQSAYRVAHRHVPTVPLQHHCKVARNIPQKYLVRDEFAMKQMYRTSSGVHAKLRRTRPMSTYHDRYHCNDNVHYMTFYDETMEKHSHGAKKQPISETKRNYQYSGSSKMDSHVLCGHSMLPNNEKYREFDLNKERGHNVWLDPYNTTNKFYHANFSNRPSSAKHDNINFWSDLTYPKLAGLNPAVKEIWTPLDCDIRHAAWGNYKYKIDQMNKMIPNRLAWTPGAFVSETTKKFTPPYHQYNSRGIIL